MKQYSKEIKEKALIDYCQKIKVNEICKKYNIPRSTIYYWARVNKKIKGTNITYLYYYKLNNQFKESV